VSSELYVYIRMFVCSNTCTHVNEFKVGFPALATPQPVVLLEGVWPAGLVMASWGRRPCQMPLAPTALSAWVP
jgi:hypothetical protein